MDLSAIIKAENVSFKIGQNMIRCLLFDLLITTSFRFWSQTADIQITALWSRGESSQIGQLFISYKKVAISRAIHEKVNLDTF